MTAAQTIVLVVGIIAAVASIFGAVVSAASARGARRSADAINSKNHQLAAIDRDAAELRETFSTFVKSLIDPGLQEPYRSGAALANGELLIASRAANSAMESYTNALTTAMVRKDVSTVGEDISSLTAAYAECQEILEVRREALLEPTLRKWWQISA